MKTYVIHGTYDELREKVRDSSDFFGNLAIPSDKIEIVTEVFLEAWIRFSMGIPPQMTAYRIDIDNVHEDVEIVDLDSGVYVNVGEFINEVMNHMADFAELIFNISSQNKKDVIISGIQCIMSIISSALPNVGKLEKKDVCVYLMLLSTAGDSGVSSIEDIKKMADEYPAQENKEAYVLTEEEIERSLMKMRSLRVIEQTAPDSYRCTF